MRLRQLTYLSRRARDLGLEETVELITHAAEKNAEVGITGFILFASRFFVQVLEGETDEVTKTFARIQADTRHSDLVILNDAQVEERAFSDWSMGFASGSEHKRAILNQAGIDDDTELPDLDASGAMKLLTALAEL